MAYFFDFKSVHNLFSQSEIENTVDYFRSKWSSIRIIISLLLSSDDIPTTGKHGNGSYFVKIYDIKGTYEIHLHYLRVIVTINHTAMQQTMKILILTLFSTSLFCQWEVKHFDDHINNNTINKIKFYDESLGYAMGERGLILRTEDQGESWQKIETDIVDDISDFAFSASGEIILTTEREKGTFKSIDGFEFNEIFPSFWENSHIEYAPGNFFLLSGEELIYRSTDGEDWEVILDMEENGYRWAYILDFHFINEQVCFAVGLGDPNGSTGTSIFLLKSTDGGINWENINEFETFEVFTTIHFIDELTGYALSHSRTYKTEDGGMTWAELTNEFGAVEIATPMDGKIITVNRPFAYNGAAMNTVFTISESYDEGTTWSGEFQDGAHLESIYFINDKVGFVAGDYSLILKTVNCGGEIGEGYPWYLFGPNSTKDDPGLKIEIYPNPATDYIFVEGANISDLNYEVRTITGQLYDSGAVINNSVEVSSYVPGLYFLSLGNRNSNKTFKINIMAH